ncbi:MAG: hypothetical protein QM533_02050 [Cytophagales bacterium]|nr:hypothetical protein [Cytophagales bacterium]
MRNQLEFPFEHMIKVKNNQLYDKDQQPKLDSKKNERISNIIRIEHIIAKRVSDANTKLNNAILKTAQHIIDSKYKGF